MIYIFPSFWLPLEMDQIETYHFFTTKQNRLKEGVWLEPVSKGACCQAWQPEFDTVESTKEKEKTTPTNYPLTATRTLPHTQIDR